MGIQQNQSSTPATNLRYSAFLGMMYVSNAESEAAIKEVKAAIGGDTEVKKGYAGDRGDTPSAKARKMLADKGIMPVSIIGTLTSARVTDRDVEGRPTPYLNVGFRDADGRYYLSIALANSAAQKIVRKLASAQPGVETSLNVFGTYGKKEGADRAYADHGASIKQGDEVPSIDPRVSLVPAVDAAMEALKAAGVEDKETLSTRRQAVELKFHREIMVDVEDKFALYYKERDMEPAESAESGVPAGFDLPDEPAF